jgi:hypothetical protein
MKPAESGKTELSASRPGEYTVLQVSKRGGQFHSGAIAPGQPGPPLDLRTEGPDVRRSTRGMPALRVAIPSEEPAIARQENHVPQLQRRIYRPGGRGGRVFRRGRSPASRSSASARRKKAGRFRVNRWIFIGAGLVVAIFLGIAFSGTISRYFPQAKQLVDLGGLQSDSFEKVLADVDGLRNEIDRINDSIDSKASHEAAFVRFKSMVPRADELVIRATRLAPLTGEELDALQKRNLRNVEEWQEQLRRERPAGPAATSIRSAD